MELSNQINYSTITPEEIRRHDAALLVTFELHPKEYREDGQRKFKDVEHIRIRPVGKAGSLSEVFRPATDEDRERFKERYEAYKKGNQEVVHGTPLNKWPEMLPAGLAAAKAAGISSVEQLASAPDTTLQRSGLVAMKYRAIDWVKSREDSSYVNSLRDRIISLEKENEGLKERLELIKDGDSTDAGKQRRGRGRPRKAG